jgi:hypothetical protein
VRQPAGAQHELEKQHAAAEHEREEEEREHRRREDVPGSAAARARPLVARAQAGGDELVARQGGDFGVPFASVAKIALVVRRA